MPERTRADALLTLAATGLAPGATLATPAKATAEACDSFGASRG
ncbi:hypothetical protein ACH4F6_21585 [Streptomyces sp. NPDC017936]